MNFRHEKNKGDDLFGQLNAFLKGQGIDFSQTITSIQNKKELPISAVRSIKTGETASAKEKVEDKLGEKCDSIRRKRLPNKQNTPKKQNMKAKKAAKKPAKKAVKKRL